MFNGVIVINKPKDISSFGVVKRVKKRFGTKKTGHIGTLDPFAQGVLPIALGKATKLIPFIQGGKKIYEGTIFLGVKTNTLDATGDIIGEKRIDKAFISEDKIKEAMTTFVGEYQQIPPMFSALKKDGVPLYKLARQGISVERKARKVKIYEFKLIKFLFPRVFFEVSVSSGTYIRSLASDFAEKLKTYGYLESLVRVFSDGFSIEKATPLFEIELMPVNLAKKMIIPMEELLGDLPRVRPSLKALKRIEHGQEVLIDEFESNKDVNHYDKVMVISPKGSLLSIAKLVKGEKGGYIKPIKVFNNLKN